MISALCNDVPPRQTCYDQVFCESQDVGFVEERATLTTVSQEITLKSNRILIHSFLLFTEINMFRTLITCDTRQ